MPRKQNRTVIGRFSRHPDGYGFVIPEDASLGQDVFIPPGKMGTATDGDRVTVRLKTSGRRRRGGKTSLEGEIIRVLARGREFIVGRLIRYGQSIYVAPLDARYHHMVRLLDEAARDVPEQQVVAVGIVTPPLAHEPPLGELLQVLGDPDDPETQYRIVCFNLDIPLEFPAEALQEAEAVRRQVGDGAGKRKDLRSLTTVTIDGESARDFDDAVSIEKISGGGFRLWVHIADVSHYVAAGDHLDREALRRGTSVYFPDRALPMLPETLSNDLCSLQPSVERLAVTVLMEVDGRGVVRQRNFFPSLISSDARLTYTQVKAILMDRDVSLRREYQSLVTSLEWMLELCAILTARRRQRGSIDFDLPEAEVEYDVQGEILDIVRSQRNEAHRIIEEFMLLANETVARYLEQEGVPLLYRIHEAPDPEKVSEFEEIAGRFGYRLERSREGQTDSHSFQKLTDKLAGQPEERFLAYLMLRSFKQARYSTLNAGHFGLAFPCYTHFTSPIRRYPDLVVHRLLKLSLQGTVDGGPAAALIRRLDEMADRSSMREQKAVEAEREIMRWLMARFMSERLGEEYEAFIIGVKRNGFYVELLEHFVEGFVPVETIWDDYYVFHPRDHALIGEEIRKSYRLGDRVRVRVDKVSPHRHLVGFSPVLSSPRAQRKRKR